MEISLKKKNITGGAYIVEAFCMRVCLYVCVCVCVCVCITKICTNT